MTAPGKDACQGDSGGPLICSIDNKAILVGVVSHGSGCGEEGKPGIYAKVDFFNQWFQGGNAKIKILKLKKLFSARGRLFHPCHEYRCRLLPG